MQPPEHPYQSLPNRAFWRLAVADGEQPVSADLYLPKWRITKEMKVATAGSCFTQHLAQRFQDIGYAVLDKEPAPAFLQTELHRHFGYGIYSARYGNIYTVRQLLQLAQEAFGKRPSYTKTWQKNGRFVDPLRPTFEPEGLVSQEAVMAHRQRHLSRVRELFLEMEILIFTLGMTETWVDRHDGTVLPVCPGVSGGEFDAQQHQLMNFSFVEIYQDFLDLRDLLQVERKDKPLKFLLTVSPVSMTATASGEHVQVQNCHSKSLLRSVVGDLAMRLEEVDYFPSYEIITSPWSGTSFFEPNQRTISQAGVDCIMRTFFSAHNRAVAHPKEAAKKQEKTGSQNQATDAALAEDLAMRVICDDELLDAFAGVEK